MGVTGDRTRMLDVCRLSKPQAGAKKNFSSIAIPATMRPMRCLASLMPALVLILLAAHGVGCGSGAGTNGELAVNHEEGRHPARSIFWNSVRDAGIQAP